MSQLYFFDGFEGYEIGKNVTQIRPMYALIAYSEGENLPTIVGEKYGIEPYAGNNMVEVRSASVGGQRAIYQNAPQPGTSIATVCSIRFCVPALEQRQQRVMFSVNTGKTFFDILLDVAADEFTLLNPKISGSLNMSFDTWHLFSARFDWVAKNCTFEVDGLELLTRPLREFDTSRATVFQFGTDQPQALFAEYPIDQGSPGVLFDNYRIEAVPEPATLLGVAGAAAGLLMKRRTV